MKKVLICIPWFNPAFRAGGPVQSIANLVAQPDLGCQFYIFCGDTDLNQEPLTGIQVNAWNRHNDWTSVYYAGPRHRKEVLNQERTRLQPDQIFVIGLYDRDFNINPMLWRDYSRTIISARGMLHPGALSQKSLKKKLFLAWFRLMRFHRSFRFHATDETEAGYIRAALGQNLRVTVAGNFPRLFHSPGHIGKRRGTLRLVCLALISPMKNHLLVLEALSGISEPVELHIAGPVKDPAYWLACQEAVKRLPGNIQVYVYGEIPPPEVQDWLAKGDVFIMPSKSENFGHSLVEAMSAGLPVITSRNTPWNNLEAMHAGFNVDLTAASVRHAINQCIEMDEIQFATWQDGAVQFAKRAINLSTLQKQYRVLFGTAAEV